MCVHAFIGLFDFLQLVMLFYFHVSRSNDAAIEYFEIEPNRIDFFFSFFVIFFLIRCYCNKVSESIRFEIENRSFF